MRAWIYLSLAAVLGLSSLPAHAQPAAVTPTAPPTSRSGGLPQSADGPPSTAPSDGQTPAADDQPLAAAADPPATALRGGASASNGGAPGGGASPDPEPPEQVEFCEETFSTERQRPKISEKFPTRGTSGHVAWFELSIEHSKGERVFPGGLELPPEAKERQLLREAEFEFPLPGSQTTPSIARTEQAGGATTVVRLPIIALPKDAGRRTLRLPALPITIARASGKVETLCSRPHDITVEDPLASAPTLEPRPDPEPRSQLEIWTAARDLAQALLVALPIALLAAWLLYRFRHRFKKVTPPPPPRPPWEIALGQLDELQNEGLLEKSEYEAYLDRASDTLREYLGARYGFEGLESTTRELLRQLERRAPDFDDTPAVRQLLQRTDLVKFARQLPDLAECRSAFEEVRRIVIASRPRPQALPDEPQKGSPSAGGRGAG